MNFGKWVSVRLVRTYKWQNGMRWGLFTVSAFTVGSDSRKNPCTVQEVLAEWFSADARPTGEGCRARVRPPLYRATTIYVRSYWPAGRGRVRARVRVAQQSAYDGESARVC